MPPMSAVISGTDIQLGEPVLQGQHQIQMHLEQSAAVVRPLRPGSRGIADAYSLGGSRSK
jgi:hypothetical protein